MNKQVIVDTIKRMLDSGIDAGIIITTLKEAGLSEQQAKQYLAEVQGTAPTQGEAVEESSPLQEMPQEDIAEKTARKVKEQLAEEKAERELKETTAQAALEGHGTKIGEVQHQVSKLHESVSEIAKQPRNQMLLNEVIGLKKHISMLEKKIEKVEAISSANKSIMEKILETDRKVLSKLQ